MSFCSDLKAELSEIRVSRCCMQALTYGLLLFGRAFTSKKISMQSESQSVTELYSTMVQKSYGADVRVVKNEGKKITYRAEVSDEIDRLRILASVDFGMVEGKISHEFFNRACCEAAFVRGAFLSCGQMSDPEKDYRVDFSVKSEALAYELRDILSRHEVKANISTRGNGFVVYIKRSEMIINLLALMGASMRSFELIETTMIKEANNKTNRMFNCDGANINKTIEASIKQRAAIEYLIKRDMLSSLPDELIAAANLRLKYPESSLKDLCKNSPDKVTVSGINHRLKKILEIYEDIISR
ncbi:MAG: DNA-binding protein WhiA [Ruminococcaceae bacterium]|nr:DNA-binding protein WhiA [Oscillospiraceae bacterium]